MEILAYIFSISAFIMMIATSMLKGKNMKGILLLLCLGNALMGFSYIINGSVNGAVSCFIGVMTALINFSLEIKNKPIPLWLIICYMVLSVVMNLWASGGIDLGMILVIGSALAYQMSVTRKNGADYRFWVLFNLIFWCSYDLVSQTYSALLTHGIQLVINVLSMFIYDRKSKKLK